MSFWPEQAIISQPIDKETILKTGELSLESWTLPSGFRDIPISSFDYSEVASFLQVNNNVGGETVTLLSEPVFRYLLKNDSVSALVSDSRGLAGTCFCLFLNCDLNGQSIRVGHTIYLCVRKDLSKKGLAPYLIRRIMELASRVKVYVGYHQVSKPIGSNSIPVTGYWYPIKPKVAASLGFHLGVKGSHSQIRDHFALPSSDYTLKPISDLEFVRSEYQRFPVKLAWDSFLDFLENCPGLTTGVVYFKNKPVSLIGYREWEIYFGFARKSVPIALVEFFTSPSREAFGAIVKDIPYPVVYFHGTGDLNDQFMKSIHAVPAGKRWVNWYNWSGVYTPDQILLPFF